MAKPEKIYHRLPGRGTNLFQHFRLYEGEDHLLLVISSGYSEIYKRFFYRDIQSIALEKTISATVWSGIWIFLLLVFGALAAVSTGGAAVGFAIPAGVFLILLGGNLVLGPTCKCSVKTAVQTEHLINFRRLRTTRKVLIHIEELIVRAQVVLGPADIQQASQEIPSRAPASEAPPAVDPLPIADAPLESPPNARQE
jgi:hypothetical protein